MLRTGLRTCDRASKPSVHLFRRFSECGDLLPSHRCPSGRERKIRDGLRKCLHPSNRLTYWPYFAEGTFTRLLLASGRSEKQRSESAREGFCGRSEIGQSRYFRVMLRRLS